MPMSGRKIIQTSHFVSFFSKKSSNNTKRSRFYLVLGALRLKQKQHFDLSGVTKLINIAYSMNNNGENRRKTKSQLFFEIEQWKSKNMR